MTIDGWVLSLFHNGDDITIALPLDASCHLLVNLVTHANGMLGVNCENQKVLSPFGRNGPFLNTRKYLT